MRPNLRRSGRRRDDPTARHGAITRFATLLVDHLRREEAAAFPLIADSFTNEEFREIEEQMSKQLSLGQSVFEIPWVLESAEPSVRALADELLPAPVRLLNRLWFTPRYRRLVATLFEDLDVVRPVSSAAVRAQRWRQLRSARSATTATASLVLSSPDVVAGASYVVSIDGDASGSVTPE